MANLYSDLNQYNPQKTAKLVDGQSVYQSVSNILGTTPGERFFNPTFGADLDSLLFELADNVQSALIEDTIIGAIPRWDPRVTINAALTFITPAPDDNEYLIQLSMFIVGLTNQNFQYQAILKDLQR